MKNLPPSKTYKATEIRVQVLREAIMQESPICDTPAKVAEFIRIHVAPTLDLEKENLIGIYLNVRRKVIHWSVISTGLLDSVLVHPREVFRPAIAVNAHSVVVAHNHPSSDTTPSDGDVRATKDLIRAGQVLKMDIMDHVIFPSIGEKFCSMRELGYFY